MLLKLKDIVRGLSLAALLGLAAPGARAEVALEEGLAGLLAELAASSAPMVPLVLDWNDSDDRRLIEGLFDIADLSDDSRASLAEVLEKAGSAPASGDRARRPSVSRLDAPAEGYWIGPVTSVVDIESTGSILAVNGVVSLAAPPARCFGLLGLAPDLSFSDIEVDALEQRFSCGNMQLRVETESAAYAAAIEGTEIPGSVALSVAEYPDGEVRFLASASATLSSGGYEVESTWPPQDAPGDVIKVCVYRIDDDCSYTYSHGQSLDFLIEGEATIASQEETFVPGYAASMTSLVQRTEGGGCYMYDVQRNQGNGLSLTYSEGDRKVAWTVNNITMYNPDSCLNGEPAVHYYFALQIQTRGTPISGVQHVYVATPHYLSTRPDLQLPPMEVAWGCLAEGTLVRLADGSTRAIETLSPGERIAVGPRGSETATLTELTNGTEPHPMLVITTLDGRRIEMTRDHPVPVGGAVLRADALRPGMVLEGERPHLIAAIEEGARMVPVYNLKLGTAAERDRLGSDGLVFLANGLPVGDWHMQGVLARAAARPEPLLAGFAVK
ncbi:MAG: hypothetical protein GYB53_10295 [Rhodobacteraceae bacterium]|nr:hypothetical protein [Paracoccaceae bacterium]